MKITKLFLWFLLLFVFSCFSILQAQNVGKIRGVAKDSESGEPLAGVNVVIKNTNMGAATNDEGRYIIVNVPAGEYTLSASIIGYATLNKTDVLVESDHTTVIDFGLEESTVEGETITVTAERDVIKMDMSSSQNNATADEIDNLPFSRDIHSFLDMQAGVSGWSIRGSGEGEIQLKVGGMAMENNAFNNPMNMVNMSSVSEISVVKGGFNAEYGNLRSGVIEVSTKEGTQEYHGSANIHYTPAHKKHTGYKITDPRSWRNRVYLDPEVCYDGTGNKKFTSPHGNEIEYRNYFRQFGGWNKMAENYKGLDGEDLRNIYIYQHGIDGYDAWNVPDAKELRKQAGLSGEKVDPLNYANKPDRDIEFSLGGPLPFGRYLGNATFFASIRDKNESYVNPTVKDYYHTRTGNFNLTSYLTRSTKLKIEYLYQKESSLTRNDVLSAEAWGTLLGIDNVVEGVEEYQQINSPFTYNRQPKDRIRSALGITIDHTISSRTTWKFKLSGSRMDAKAKKAIKPRLGTSEESPGEAIAYMTPDGIVKDENVSPGDTTGGYYPLTEAPYGHSRYSQYWNTIDGEVEGGLWEGQPIKDNSENYSISADFDITSQINRYHEIKAGLKLSYHHFNADYSYTNNYDPTRNFTTNFDGSPITGAAYIQDKFEYKGLIANVGVRMEMYDPNTEWYKLDSDSLRYSKYFSAAYKSQFDEKMPKEDVKPKIAISPRIGVSHPITKTSKIYFNYGHQYSNPGGVRKFNVNYSRPGYGINFIGNPRLDLPRTISYELGFDQKLFKNYLISIAGYYKDASREIGHANYGMIMDLMGSVVYGNLYSGRGGIGSVYYQNIGGSVSYTMNSNNAYRVTRGLEISLEKRWGDWITGAIHYTIMSEKSGIHGREAYFEDPMKQRLAGYSNPIVEKPLPLPHINGYLTFMTPQEYGPNIAGIHPLSNWNITTSFYWGAGGYMTWEPIGAIKRAQNNVQYRDYYNADMRISKRFNIDNYSAKVYIDISNVFNIRQVVGGFVSDQDERNYYNSLHLEEYKKDKYKGSEKWQGGNDKIGDYKADYINLPNNDFMRKTMGRQITAGINIEF